MPIKGVRLGKGVVIPYPALVNLYGCEIGDGCFIGPFVEIQNNVKVGAKTRIQSHSFICSNVKIGRGVFISHGAIFINDKYPVHRDPKYWSRVSVGDGAVIGSNATILPCKIGARAMVGAGAVVTRDVPPRTVVAGNPARKTGMRR